MQLDGELAFVLPTESSQVQIHLQSKQTRAKGFIHRFIDFLFPLASESGVDWSSEVEIIKRAHTLTTAPKFVSPFGHCILR